MRFYAGFNDKNLLLRRRLFLEAFKIVSERKNFKIQKQEIIRQNYLRPWKVGIRKERKEERWSGTRYHTVPAPDWCFNNGKWVEQSQ